MTTPQHRADLFIDPDGDFNGAVPDPAVVEEAWSAWHEETAFADKFIAGNDFDHVGHCRDG